MTGRDTGRPSEGPATRLLLHRRSLLGAGVAFGLTASPLAAPRPELRPLSESDPGVVPTAPPRMLASFGADASGHGFVALIQSPYAAMPSGHVAFAVITAGIVCSLAPWRWVRVTLFTYPALVYRI